MSRKAIETLILCLILSICIIVIYLHKKSNTKKPEQKSKVISREGEESVGMDNPAARARWELARLKDPATGKIPYNIREQELAFAATLPNDRSYKLKSTVWTNRGPYNVGGRTRALALDIADENTIIAGGISGGVWRSTDGGQHWNEQTAPGQLHSVSCVAQDTRQGKRNTWYYGTGEVFGDSPSAVGAFFLGNGMYKSEDNGLTWNSIASTAANYPHSFNNMWDIVWNIALDKSQNDSDVVYAASIGTIFRTKDGGNTWKTVLGGGSNYSLYADIAATKQGVVYATLGKEEKINTNGGIYRSVDGLKWTRITPDSFPQFFYRVIIAVNPSDENELYFLGVSKDKGVLSLSYFNRSERLVLWKYNYISGDGTGSGGQWTELTENLPVYNKNVFDNYYSQGTYNMTMKVKPDEPNVVFIGGTNLYRSTDGFTTKNNITQIGGYETGTTLPDFQVYKNHHPDQHNMVFMPSDANKMISATDGGLFKTFDCRANTVEWQNLNNGYNTTQLYTVAIDEDTNSDLILAGFQDNGNYFTNSSDPKKAWTLPLNGDGSFGAITDAGKLFYISKQEGKTFKMTLKPDGTRNTFTRIDPAGGKNLLFVNPFALDPNNNNIMYMAGGRKLWRNDSLNYIALNNKFDSISKGWYVFADTLTAPDTAITAVVVSKSPANIVYYGTNRKNVFRIDNANTKTAKRTTVTGSKFPFTGNGETAYVSCIAIDPEDANKVFVVFSNYNVYSLFYTEDAGKNWIKVGGNLEPNLNGTGAGPSCRWVSILAYPDGKRIYFLGTSTGLYATDRLVDHTTTDKTIWTQVAADVIGNVVVDMVKTRSKDNLVVVATHGHGVYSAHINSFSDLQSVFDISRDINAEMSLYPNPAHKYIDVSIAFAKPQQADISIYNRSGMLVKEIGKREIDANSLIKINVSDLAQGIYICAVRTNDKHFAKRFLVVK